MEEYDFGGWATKNNLRCADGRTICKDAFADNDGKMVPLVWNHDHNNPSNVLGHALLENREDGVYAHCKFNDTDAGKDAKLLVQHGDVTALSIYANKLKEMGGNVIHGMIREVSLVLAGANPGAFIDSVMAHGEDSEDEATIYTGEDISLEHSADSKKKDPEEEKPEEKKPAADPKKKEPETQENPDDSEETIRDVLNTMSEKQLNATYALVAEALYESEGETPDDNEADDTGDNSTSKESTGGKAMKHNVFDNETNDQEEQEQVLSHSDMEAIIKDAAHFGSMKASLNDYAMQHGITNIELLFPDAKTIDSTPQFIQRDMGWVAKVMGDVHHTPFSRIKSIFANITEEDARARGYIKGKLKKEEVFSLLKRTTDPQTVYKKQKIDRDDVIDITDFDVIAWLKSEMRMMLDEELARAILVGDGRLASSDDKISADHIRPIWGDAELYTVNAEIPVTNAMTDDAKAKAFIRAAIKARKDYKGSGNPSLYTTEDMVTDCLLLEDTTGRVIYDSVDKLATALRVKEIITVPVMENLSRTADSKTFTLGGIIVNLSDYNVGADKGGAVTLFDDFDIDYNQQKYLIETRCSGAMIRPYSAIAIEFSAATAG
mgnify:CR=1 FL=1